MVLRTRKNPRDIADMKVKVERQQKICRDSKYMKFKVNAYILGEEIKDGVKSNDVSPSSSPSPSPSLSLHYSLDTSSLPFPLPSDKLTPTIFDIDQQHSPLNNKQRGENTFT